MTTMDGPASPVPRREAAAPNYLFSALQVVGLFGLGGYFVATADTSGFGALATPRAAGWLVAAVLVYCVGQLLNGLAWRHLLVRAGGNVTLLEMIQHDLSSVFWSTMLPGGIVGDIVKGVRLARGADAGAVAVSILCARLVGGTTACMIALVCLPFSGFGALVRAVGAVALVGTMCVGVGGLAALAFGPAALPAFVASRLPVGRFPATRDLLIAFGLAIVTHSVFAVVFSAGFAAVGPWMPFADGAVVSALTSVAQIVPLSVGGMGVRELSISGLGAELVPKPAADAAAVALALTFTVFVALGGLVEVWRMVRGAR